MPVTGCECCGPTQYRQAKLCLSGAVVDVWMTDADARLVQTTSVVVFTVNDDDPECLHFVLADPTYSVPGTLYTFSDATIYGSCTTCTTSPTNACFCTCQIIAFTYYPYDTGVAVLVENLPTGLWYLSNPDTGLVWSSTVYPCANVTKSGNEWQVVAGPSGNITFISNAHCPPIVADGWTVDPMRDPALIEVVHCSLPAMDCSTAPSVVALTGLWDVMQTNWPDDSVPDWDGSTLIRRSNCWYSASLAGDDRVRVRQRDGSYAAISINAKYDPVNSPGLAFIGLGNIAEHSDYQVAAYSIFSVYTLTSNVFGAAVNTTDVLMPLTVEIS